MCERKKILIVTGPTCVGKTQYAIDLARRIDGEIVSCDSMQIYKFMDIGSAKPTPKERASARHHLIDFADPGEKFSVAEYKKLALKAIEDILKRNKLPILSGGTGLYINSIIYDMDFSGASYNEEYRRTLENIAKEKGSEELHKILEKKSYEKAAEIHPNNTKKLIRALEIIHETGASGRPFSGLKHINENFHPIMICLSRERTLLYDRINKRVDMLIEEGLVDEVKALINLGLNYDDISMKGIGYKEVISYLNGEYDFKYMTELIKKNTRHYAKRQITWFKRYDFAKWFDITYKTKEDALDEILRYLEGVDINVKR